MNNYTKYYYYYSLPPVPLSRVLLVPSRRRQADKDGERLSAADVARALQLEELQTTHAVALETFEVSALKGTDVERAFQWLTDQV